MKFLVALLLVVGVSTANKTPLRTRGRVDGLQRAQIDISGNLAESGFAATSTLDATCTGNTATLTLAVTDAGDELDKSGITVGPAGVSACTKEDAGATVVLDLGANACGRVATVGDASTVYTWQVTVEHHPTQVGTAPFVPYISTHQITCEVAITNPEAVDAGEQPAAITGDAVADTSAAIQLSLVKLGSSTNRLWQLTVAPADLTAVPGGLSYRLDSCTAKPVGADTPALPLIVGGCITPKTGTRATYASANKQYSLTVRAFGFTGVEGNIEIECTAVLCSPEEATGLCADQPEGALSECPVNGGGEVPEGRANKPMSQLPNQLVRHVRSAKQYITSNVVAL